MLRSHLSFFEHAIRNEPAGDLDRPAASGQLADELLWERLLFSGARLRLAYANILGMSRHEPYEVVQARRPDFEAGKFTYSKIPDPQWKPGQGLSECQ